MREMGSKPWMAALLVGKREKVVSRQLLRDRLRREKPQRRSGNCKDCGEGTWPILLKKPIQHCAVILHMSVLGWCAHYASVYRDAVGLPDSTLSSDHRVLSKQITRFSGTLSQLHTVSLQRSGVVSLADWGAWAISANCFAKSLLILLAKMVMVDWDSKVWSLLSRSYRKIGPGRFFISHLNHQQLKSRVSPSKYPRKTPV